MTAIVTLYNHKGGVSKTTTTFNLAHLLADRGHRVLVVDADAQCNITELLLSETIAELDRQAAATGQIIELPGTSLLDVLKPRIDGDVSAVDLDTITLVPVKHRFDLLPGSVDLNSIEDSIAEAHVQRFSNKIHDKRTYVAIADFLRRLGQQRAYDYIFLDVGPSSGALTRACFLACDYFFVPVAPDRFNYQAIRTLAVIIERWIREHSQVVDAFIELGLPVAHGRPVFLGTIAQYFKLYRGRPKPGYQMWMDRIPQRVMDLLIPALVKADAGERTLVYPGNRNDIMVTEIPDFQSLAPLMQDTGFPVYAIPQSATAAITETGRPWGGNTWTNAEQRMADYRQRLELVASRLETAVRVP